MLLCLTTNLIKLISILTHCSNAQALRQTAADLATLAPSVPQGTTAVNYVKFPKTIQLSGRAHRTSQWGTAPKCNPHRHDAPGKAISRNRL